MRTTCFQPARRTDLILVVSLWSPIVVGPALSCPIRSENKAQPFAASVHLKRDWRYQHVKTVCEVGERYRFSHNEINGSVLCYCFAASQN